MFRRPAKKPKTALSTASTTTRVRKDEDEDEDEEGGLQKRESPVPSSEGTILFRSVMDRRHRRPRPGGRLQFDTAEKKEQSSRTVVVENKDARRRRRQPIASHLSENVDEDWGDHDGGDNKRLKVHDDEDVVVAGESFPESSNADMMNGAQETEANKDSWYGTHAMAQLLEKQRQINRQVVRPPSGEKKLPASFNVPHDVPVNERNEASLPNPLGLADVVLFDSNILTGEQAEQAVSASTGIPLRPQQTDSDDDDDAWRHSTANSGAPTLEEEWQDQVARRAGVATARNGTTRPRDNVTAPGKTPDSLLRNVQATLQVLRQEQHDLSTRRQRRQADLLSAQAELARYQNELAMAGRFVEEYQVLRADLAAWVGAMRQLQAYLTPLLDRLVAVVARRAARDVWRTWQDDAIGAVTLLNLVDHVVGRLVVVSPLENLPTVDEFGRDLKSQQALAREKRLRRHYTVWEEWSSQDHVELSVLPRAEQDQYTLQWQSCQAALEVALESFEPEYLDLAILFGLFQKWRRSNPQEYEESYASLSVADLTGVLIVKELTVALYGEDNSVTSPSWPPPWTVQLRHSVDHRVLSSDGLKQVLEKFVTPLITDLLDHQGFSASSAEQSSRVSKCLRLIQLSFNISEPMEQLLRRLSAYLKDELDAVAMPILVSDARQKVAALSTTSSSAEIKMHQVALWSAADAQLIMVRDLLRNTLVFFAPLLSFDDSFVAYMLEFLSSKFLMFLSSVHGLGPFEDKTLHVTAVFQAVWAPLQETRWLHDDQWMIQAMPLRAAAAVYAASGDPKEPPVVS
jgi:hypothetical protein